MEIERKFLIEKIPFELENYEHHELSQGYISVSPVIRIRKSDDSYILTVKSGGLLAREEYEINLSEEEYTSLIPKVEGNFIDKTRYIIPLEKEKLRVELDVFHGIYDGLIYAEVEFPDIETAEGCTPPEYFGREVTSDGQYTNASLSNMTDPASFIESIKSVN